jgi:VTC domain
MAGQHRLQENRFELKYVIDEVKALQIRDFARSYLEPDEHADPNRNYGYPIHSLYLDNARNTLLNGTVFGLKNRFKLRIRYYDDSPTSPIFFEIKRRVNDAILKKRAAVKRSSLFRLLDGGFPQMDDLYKLEDHRGLDSLRQFCELRDRTQAVGKVIVSYFREAWVTPDNNSVRLTFDRDVYGEPFAGQLSIHAINQGSAARFGGVILELKFTDRYPIWMKSLAQVFSLQRVSAAKYVECSMALRMNTVVPGQSGQPFEPSLYELI